MRVELLIAREDGMWDTKIEEVPDSIVRGDADGFSQWCCRELPHQKYGDAVLFAVYNDNPDADDEGQN
jgi:hypothetical protein